MVAPNLVPAPGDVRRKAILSNPILGNLIISLLPVFTKPIYPERSYPRDTLDPIAANQSFNTLSLPTHRLREMWEMQDQISLKAANFADLTIIYGEYDLSVDNEASLMVLEREGIPFSSKSFPNSAHNLLEDYDAEAATDYVIQLLSR